MEHAFFTVLNMSVAGGIAIVLALLLRLILRRGAKWPILLLWGVVALRLTVPIFFESPFAPIPEASFIKAAEVGTVPTAAIPSGSVPASAGPVQTVRPVQTTAVSVETTAAIGQTITFVPVQTVPAETPAPAATQEAPVVTAAPKPTEAPAVIGASTDNDPGAPSGSRPRPVRILSFIWLAGCGAMLIYSLVSYFLLKKKLSSAVLLREGVYESEYALSPFTLGIFRPNIYVPFSLDEKRLGYVLGHEKAHLRTADQLWKALGFAVLSLHWFNPLVWLGYVLFCRDLELACDERAVKRLTDEERAEYSQTLLDLSAKKHSLGPSPLAFGEGDAKTRIKSVLNYKKPKAALIVLAVVLAAALAACTFTANKPNGENGGETDQTAAASPSPTAGPTETPEPVYEVPEGYDAHDYGALRSFFEAPDESGVPNGKKCFASYDPDDPATWIDRSGAPINAVSWNDDGKVSAINIWNPVEGMSGRLKGVLDLSSFEALKDEACINMVMDSVTLADLPEFAVENNFVAYFPMVEGSALIRGGCVGGGIYMLSASSTHCEITGEISGRRTSAYPPAYTVDVTVEGSGYAGVNASHNEHYFVVAVKAVPKDGARFIGWFNESGELISAEPELELTDPAAFGFPEGASTEFVYTAKFESETTPAPTAVLPETPDPRALAEFSDPAFEALVRHALGYDEHQRIINADLAELTSFGVFGEDIRSIEDAHKLPNLKKLYVNGAPNIDFSELSGFKRLNSLAVINCGIKDISFVEPLTALKEFTFDGAEVTDLSPLAGHAALQTLSFGSTGIVDLSPIAELPRARLTRLWIHDQPDIDPSPIARMTGLESLSLINCGIEEIFFISSLSNLTELDLSCNYIDDLVPITLLPNLQHVGLRNNRIENVGLLFDLLNIRWIDLSFNPIPLDRIDALNAALVHVNDDNPVEFYPRDRESLACWPVDLDDDGTDEYFYLDLDGLIGDFISFVWVENAEHRLLGSMMQCGTGHVAYSTFAVVQSPEFGTCLMRIYPEWDGSCCGYELYDIVNGDLRSVRNVFFYSYDSDEGNLMDPAEAAAYEAEINALLENGCMLVSTDRYGVLTGTFVNTRTGEEFSFPFENGYSSVIALIRGFGSVGSGLSSRRAAMEAEGYVFFDDPVTYRFRIDPEYVAGG